MLEAYNDVAAFHHATDTPVLTVPTVPSIERRALRISLIEEEVIKELIPLIESGNDDLVAIADAITDSIYVLIGTALEYGIPLPHVWNIVQGSNMAKVDPITGKVIKRGDGKILKPEGWQPPEPAIFSCLADYGAK